jgi:hypothetical protein
VVDDEAHVEKLLPILDEMGTGGALVTVERVRVVRYAAPDISLSAHHGRPIVPIPLQPG